MRLFTVILIALISFQLTAGEEAIKPVTIATFNHDSPGLNEIENVVSAMYKKVNIPFVFKRYSMARALIEAKEGRVDALIGHPVGTDDIVRGLEPIGENIKTQRFALFSTKEKDLELNHYKIVVLRGMPYLEQALERKGLHFITHPEVEKIAELLLLDRYDTTILSVENTNWAQEKVKNLKQVSDIILEFPIVHFVSKKRPEIIQKFKASIQ